MTGDENASVDCMGFCATGFAKTQRFRKKNVEVPLNPSSTSWPKRGKRISTEDDAGSKIGCIHQNRQKERSSKSVPQAELPWHPFWRWLVSLLVVLHLTAVFCRAVGFDDRPRVTARLRAAASMPWGRQQPLATTQ